MKKRLLSLVFILMTLVSQAQLSHSPVNEVLNAIRINRVQEVSRYMDNFISITLNNSQSLYSKNQAEIIIKDFFDKNPASDFSMADEGSADKNSKFAIANFNASGEKFSLYILFKQKDNTFLVQEIRINRE